jgi:hypothetical protein
MSDSFLMKRVLVRTIFDGPSDTNNFLRKKTVNERMEQGFFLLLISLEQHKQRLVEFDKAAFD